ncbi:MAG: DMT family transporter, partial [Pseudomonadota bacterium]
MQLWGIAAAMAAIIIYAGMFTVGRHGGASGLDGFDQTALRFIVSFLVLIPFVFSRVRGIVARLGLWRILALLVLQGAVYSFVFLAGLVFAPVAYGAALVPGLQPFVVMAWSFAVLGERPGSARLIGLVVCLLGCGTIIFGNLVALTSDVVFGISLFLLSALMWGSYTFLLRQWSVKPLDALFVVGVSS